MILFEQTSTWVMRRYRLTTHQNPRRIFQEPLSTPFTLS